MAEITSTKEPDFDFPLSVSSGDSISGETDSDLSDDTPAEQEDAGTEGAMTSGSGSPEYGEELLVLLQEIQETQTEILVSQQRQELQFEACISILMIFLIVGLLNYIYKFFKMFF